MFLVGDLTTQIREWKKQGQLMPEAVVINYLIQIIEGLQHAHKADVQHQDLKPENIMIDRDG